MTVRSKPEYKYRCGTVHKHRETQHFLSTAQVTEMPEEEVLRRAAQSAKEDQLHEEQADLRQREQLRDVAHQSDACGGSGGSGLGLGLGGWKIV